MKKTNLLLALIFLLGASAFAQSEYKSAVGGRVGIPIAGSIKHFISEAGALEGYLGFAGEGPAKYTAYYGGTRFVIGAMYQHHFPIGDIDGLQWYVGGGPIVQFFNVKDNNNPGDYSSTAIGINGVGGVDYKFRGIPLNVSADWMPVFFLSKTHYPNFHPSYGGIAARYTFR